MDNNGDRPKTSPRKSPKWEAQETIVSRTSAQKATKLLKLQTCFQGTPSSCENKYFNWFLQSVHDGEVYPHLVFFHDEAWFPYVEM
jgi:hypothetical protein